MPLTPGNWPSASAIRRSLTERFEVPPLPPVMLDWFSWCQGMGDQSLWLKDPEWREDWGGVLGPGASDPHGLICAMEGYRFILDQKASTPERLEWTDSVQTGHWQLHWIVLLAADGDPLIGDISQPEVPILWDWHGSGAWSPKPLFPDVRTLMQRVEVYTPPPREDAPPTIFYTVHLTELGQQPLRVLSALKKREEYSALAPAQLMALKHRLPLVLMEKSVSVVYKNALVARYEGLGAVVKVTEDLL